MRTELKKAIIDWMFENKGLHQLVNGTHANFRQYVYTPEGDYCIGGKEVSEFVSMVDKLIRY